jgi:hypothetical protein
MVFKTVREFAEELAEQHRPLKMPGETFGHNPGVLLVGCPACHQAVKVWIEGDPPVECRYWRTAVEFGLVNAE